jgi:DNA-binding LacI/PurR family transcriptional regulator
VTSFDVARLAGVSQSTVSLVLSGKGEGRVSPSVQDAVLRACKQLNYHPNAAARSLRLGRTRTIAVVVADALHPFYAALLRHASQAARARDYAVILVDMETRLDWQEVLFETLNAHEVDGFILCAPVMIDLRGYEDQVVLLEAQAPGVPNIDLDIEGGTRAALKHLIALGHTRIAHLAGVPPGEQAFQLRGITYRRMLEEYGLPLYPAYERRAAEAGIPFAMQRARSIARELLSLPEPPTAIFCDDDLFAIGVYKAAHDLRLRIPADLSIVGFDDIEAAQYVEPELTTVAIPADLMGSRAANMLIERLETPSAVQGEHLETLPLRLVVRGSTAPPSRSSS